MAMPQRQSGSSSRKLADRGRSYSSLYIRPLPSERGRRELPRGVTAKLQHRTNIRITENGVDLTPKLLTDLLYSPIDERQLTAFDTIALSRNASATHLAITSPAYGMTRSGSMSLVRSSSMHTNIMPFEETTQSILSTQEGMGSQKCLGSDEAPSQFRLSRYDSRIFYLKPEVVTITIKETETFFLFEMPQLTADLKTAEGLMVKEANERYQSITVGPGSNRKLVNAETQTPKIHTKPRSTFVAQDKRQNRGTFVNNWVMHDDTHASSEIIDDSNKRHVQSLTTIPEINARQEERRTSAEAELQPEGLSAEDYLSRISAKVTFRDVVRVMERIIASNLYIVAQKRFKSLIQKDPCSLDLEFTYTPELLWIHSCTLTKGRKVSCVKWNPANGCLLAAGYGASATEKDGALLVWSMKNPSQPERTYRFPCPISDADWSFNKPNQLAIGFYDGSLIVIDVSKKDLLVLRKSSRLLSPSYSPHWQVQWWFEDEQYDYQEHIYTSNQNGKITCYRTGEDFTSSEIMRISRVESRIGGVGRTDRCNLYDIPISRNPGAILLRRHPERGAIYFVGTDEGCVHRCSTNYLHQEIDSFVAHDGAVYAFQFSPFCSKIFLTCGADWSTRIWAEGITEPLVTLTTRMACVRGASWCPNNSTVIASIVNNEICMWDIKRKTYRPTSVAVSSGKRPFVSVHFTSNGKQLVAADANGDIRVYALEGMPFPPLDQITLLVQSIEKALVTKPGLLRKLRKIGNPFSSL